MKECDLCRGTGEMCGNKCEGYTCTRRKGHSGDHAACGAIDHPIATWDDDKNFWEVKWDNAQSADSYEWKKVVTSIALSASR